MPSGRWQETVRASIGRPPFRSCFTASNIACITRGMPAMTKTLPMRKPGARDTGLRMSEAPSGVCAILSRASLSSSGL